MEATYKIGLNMTITTASYRIGLKMTINIEHITDVDDLMREPKNAILE